MKEFDFLHVITALVSFIGKPIHNCEYVFTSVFYLPLDVWCYRFSLDRWFYTYTMLSYVDRLL